MNGHQRAELILKHFIRAGQIIDLACATFTYDIDLKGDELLDDLLAPVVDLHPTLLPLRRELDNLSEEDQNDVSECLAALWASGFTGYAIQFHAPSGNNTDHPNFGSFYTQWIYAESIEEAWQHACKWGDECRQQLQLDLESEE